MSNLPKVEYVEEKGKWIRKTTNKIEVSSDDLKNDANQILDLLKDVSIDEKKVQDKKEERKNLYNRTKEILDDLDKVSKCGTIPEIDLDDVDNFPTIEFGIFDQTGVHDEKEKE